MSVLAEIAAGAAVIAVPQVGAPLLGCAALVQGCRQQAQREADDAATNVAEGNGAEAALWGAPPPATLTFQNVTSLIAGRKNKPVKTILSSVSGSATPGRLLALMGPSGSGKSSLLNALASHTPITKGMALSGVLRINGGRPEASGVRVGYVQQHDMFYSQMTVRETLDMVATLRLPRALSQADRDAAVAEVVQKLDLSKVLDTAVGDRKTRGVSGGEKKRLSIACELLTKPSLLFLDEPTTGLDAFQALQVMQALKQLANDGHTVVAAIHQPRSRIFELFDDLLLLSEGRPVYSGPVSGALDHFADLGHECPSHYNPAEFLADLISPDLSSEESAAQSEKRIMALLAHAPQPRMPDVAAPAGEQQQHASVREPPPLPLQLRCLLKRSWRQVTRDKAAIKLRVFSNMQSALVFGTIWWRLRNIQKAVASRLGMLQVVAVFMSQSALFKTLNLFPPEKNLVAAERAKGSYDVLPYFLSKLLAELPMIAAYPLLFSAVLYPMAGLQPSMKKFALFAGSNIAETLSSNALGMAIGSVAPSTEAALVLGPAIMLVFIVFGGQYTNVDDMPKWLSFLPHTSAIKCGYDALCKNEFQGLSLQPDDGGKKRRDRRSYKDGDEVLAARGFRGSPASSIAQQGRIMLTQWWITVCILRANRPTFQEMEEPEAVGEA